MTYRGVLRFGLRVAVICLMFGGLAVFAVRLYHAVPRLILFGLQDWWYVLWLLLPGILTIAAGLCYFRCERWIINRAFAPAGRAVVRVLHARIARPATLSRKALLVSSVVLYGVTVGACAHSYWVISSFTWEFGSWESGQKHFSFGTGFGHLYLSVMRQTPPRCASCPRDWPWPFFKFKHTDLRTLNKRDRKYWPAWIAPVQFRIDYDFSGRFGQHVSFSLPLWVLVGAFAIPMYLAIRPETKARSRRRRGLCVRCAYDLTGNKSGVCPECGTSVEPIPSGG